MYILALIAKHLPTSMPYVLHRRPKIVSIDGVLSLQPKPQLSFWQLLVKSWLTFFFVKLAYILGFTQKKNEISGSWPRFFGFWYGNIESPFHQEASQPANITNKKRDFLLVGEIKTNNKNNNFKIQTRTKEKV